MTKKSVLLTGATGFLGRHLVENLLLQGNEVRAVVRGAAGDDLPMSDNLRMVKVPDLFTCSEGEMDSLFSGIDVVINAAWYVEPGNYLYSEKNLICLEGSLRLAQSAVRNGVKKFLGIGTCFEYDVTCGYLTCRTPLKPSSLYAATKVAAYECTRELLSRSDTLFTWCRLFYLYGEGEDCRRLVPYIRSCLEQGVSAQLTHGNQIRDFMDVALAAKQVVDAAMGDHVGSINICSGVPTTVRQFAEKIADEYGLKHLLAFGTRPENITDPLVVVGDPYFKNMQDC